jgi:hypothetical protein
MDRLDPHATQATPDPISHGGQGGFAGDVPGGTFDPWTYRDEAGVAGVDLTGYRAEASDGSIGKIDAASYTVNDSYLVVDTGPWIFGKKVMLPAGTVNHVDHDGRAVHIDRTRDQIKAAPEYAAVNYADPVYREMLGGYYGETYSPLPPGPIR